MTTETNEMTFAEWVAERLGTRHWVVAPRLTDKLSRTHTLAVSQRAFTALRMEYAAMTTPGYRL